MRDTSTLEKLLIQRQNYTLQVFLNSPVDSNLRAELWSRSPIAILGSEPGQEAMRGVLGITEPRRASL